MAEKGENEVVLRVESGKSRAKHEADDDAPDLSSAPIFSDLEGAAKDKLDHVIVERLGPVREGELGRFEPDVTTADIFERHGGGKYRVQGRNKGSRPLPGAFATVELAGDPILQSLLARQQYARIVGQGGPTPGTPAGPTLPEIVELLERTRSTGDSERERRAEAEEARHKRELERIKLEGEQRLAVIAAEDQRRRALDDERETRRKRDDDERRKQDKIDSEEREDRRRREDDARVQRDREFQATMLKATQASAPAANPIEMLLAGVNLVQKLKSGGGGDGEGVGDPLTALATSLPQTVQELGKMFKGGAATVANPSDLVIAGELGAKGTRALEHAQRLGHDPSSILNSAFDLILKITSGPKPAAAPRPAAGAQPGPPRRTGPGGRPISPPATRQQAPVTAAFTPAAAAAPPAEPPPDEPQQTPAVG